MSPLLTRSLKRSAVLAALTPSAVVVAAFAPISGCGGSHAQIHHNACHFHVPITTKVNRPGFLVRSYATLSDNDKSAAIATASTTSGSSAVRSMKPAPTDLPYFQMVSFYRFAPISDPASARDALFDALIKIDGLRGTAYLAAEGINAQFAVPTTGGEDGAVESTIQRFTKVVRDALPFDPFEINTINYGDLVDSTLPTFNRLIVRTRDAILRSGLEGEGHEDIDQVTTYDWDDAGRELTPEEWDADLRDAAATSSKEKKGILLDCRNAYESDVGTFADAVPLGTDAFSESWDILKDKTEGMDKSKPVRIFCTGGIRCVKVGAYLKQELGFEDVRRLEHGIVGYERWSKNLVMAGDGDGGEKNKESLWRGENFLFDKRRLNNDDGEERGDS